MQANRPHPITVDVPNPERKLPNVASAKLSNLMPSPERTIASPVSTNNGMAISANESTPSNNASPTRVNGNTSVSHKIATVPRPIAAQNGTPNINSTMAPKTQRETIMECFYSSNIALPANTGWPACMSRQSRAIACNERKTTSVKPSGTAISNHALLIRNTGVVPPSVMS